jgi:hypothetical protein
MCKKKIFKVPSFFTPRTTLQIVAVSFSKSATVLTTWFRRLCSEPVFVNDYGAQESIPRNRFRQPIWLGGPVRQIGLSYWPARLGIYSWAP